jgi:hypothetical protein
MSQAVKVINIETHQSIIFHDESMKTSWHHADAYINANKGKIPMLVIPRYDEAHTLIEKCCQYCKEEYHYLKALVQYKHTHKPH